MVPSLFMLDLSRIPRLHDGDVRLGLRRALWTSALSFVAPTLVSLFTNQGSFVGAHDDRAAELAAVKYEAFLGDVARAMIGVALGAWAIVFVLTFAVFLATTALLRRYEADPRRQTPLFVVLAVAVVAVLWGRTAHAHPGLFLETLSNSRVLAAVATVAPFAFWPLVVFAFLGASLGLVHVGERRFWLGVGIIGVVATALFGWRAVRRSAKPTTYGAASRAKEDAKRLAREEKTDDGKDKDKDKRTEDLRSRMFPLAKRPNILWIAVDSLRPDKIDPEHTPNIAQLLGESAYFPNAVVTVPRTGPSWTSALTSLSPLANGVETMFPRAELGKLTNVSLPAHLVHLGYRTSAVSEYAGEFFGRVDFGFETLAVPRVELAEISGQLLLQRAPLVLAAVGEAYSRDWYVRQLLGDPLVPLVRGMPQFSRSEVMAIDTVTTLVPWDPAEREKVEKKPFFALLFYSQPHFPYTSSAPYYEKWRARGSSPSIRYGRDATNETPIENDADRRQLDGLYRGALAETDKAIGDLLARLRAQNLLDDTIIVVSADHGEGLYECATCVGHGDNLRGMTTLKVPLAFRLPRAKFPKAKIGTVDTWVSTLDVYPTLLTLLGESRIVVHEGSPLLSTGGEVTAPEKRTFFAETGEWLWSTNAVPKTRVAYPPITGLASIEKNRIAIDAKWEPVIRSAKHRAVVRPPWKLMYEPGDGHVDWHLYRIDQDPYDDHDVIADNPAVADELRAALRQSVLRHPQMLEVDGFFVTRAPPPPEEEW